MQWVGGGPEGKCAVRGGNAMRGGGAVKNHRAEECVEESGHETKIVPARCEARGALIMRAALMR